MVRWTILSDERRELGRAAGPTAQRTKWSSGPFRGAPPSLRSKRGQLF